MLAATAATLVAASTPAAAHRTRDDVSVTYLPVGLLVASRSIGEPSFTSFGLELSVVHHRRDWPFALGGVVQAEAIALDRGGVRLALAGELSWLFVGVELGLALVPQTRADEAHAVAMHAAPFLSLALLGVAFRFDAPVAGLGRGGLPDIAASLVLTIKYPLRIQGRFEHVFGGTI